MTIKHAFRLLLRTSLVFSSASWARLGEGWVVQVRQMGDESILGARGFTVERALNDERSIFQIRAKSRSVLQRFQALSLDSSVDALVSASLENLQEILAVEPNHIYRKYSGARRSTELREELDADRGPNLNFPEVIPSDPYFQSQWGLRNRAQAVNFGKQGLSGADVRASGAWIFEKGSDQVVVAVIDSGIDLQHEDLKDNLWTKIEGDKTIHGYNAWNSSLSPDDDNGHGTHVAGIIAAVGDNGMGVSGISWKAALMAVKVLNENGEGDLARIIAGIDFAVENGARVINASWGSSRSSAIMEDAIRRAEERGVLFVAAAGNDGDNNDVVSSFPANYALSNVVSVAASDNQDALADFSNYGAKKVHIAAPGVSIISTLPDDHYGAESGTSMAAPFVSGAAALLLSRSPNLDASGLKSAILNKADRITGLKGKVGANGLRLNVLNLMK